MKIEALQRESTDWRMEKVASQEMLLLFYSDAEGCSEIDFHQNLFCSWLVAPLLSV
jgi:hypothetical protein